MNSEYQTPPPSRPSYKKLWSLSIGEHLKNSDLKIHVYTRKKLVQSLESMIWTVLNTWLVLVIISQKSQGINS